MMRYNSGFTKGASASEFTDPMAIRSGNLDLSENDRKNPLRRDLSKQVSDISGDANLTNLTQTVTTLLLKYWERVKLLWFEFTLTPVWLLIVPSLALLVLVGGYLTLLNLAVHISLPSLVYFNGFHVGLFILCDLTVATVMWALRQRIRFEEAWNLVYNTSTVSRVQDAIKGHLTYFDMGIALLVASFVMADLTVAFEAEWAKVGQYGSDLGSYPCQLPYYNSDTLAEFRVRSDVVSGDIDFAEIYMYGIPSMDGLIAGLAPWPLANPLDDFIIRGPGPVIALKVDCVGYPENWNGTSPIQFGSGSFVSELSLNTRSFNVNIDVVLPAAGFGEDLGTTTEWVQQRCLVQGYMGNGTWFFNYLVDEWQMVTAGKAVALNVGPVQLEVGDTSESATDTIINVLKAQDAKEMLLEYSAVINAFGTAIEGTLNGAWYAPSQGGTFSNIMSWATQPDGFYYGSLTSRGLKAALGAILHQILLQYDAQDRANCLYWGADGSGKMTLNETVVVIINILLAMVTALTIGASFTAYFSHPRRIQGLFRIGALNLADETTRFFNMASWGNEYVKRQGKLDPARSLLNFNRTSIRYGTRRHRVDMGINTYVIGPENEVVKMKQKRQSAKGPTDKTPLTSAKAIIKEIAIPAAEAHLNDIQGDKIEEESDEDLSPELESPVPEHPGFSNQSQAALERQMENGLIEKVPDAK